MADYERQNQGQGHRGRKRRFRDDDDVDRRSQRRRYEEPLSNKLRKQLLAIAESATRKAEDHAGGIAKTVTENYDDEDLRDTFLTLIIQLVTEQPFKIPFLAAVVLVVNTQKPELAAEALKKAAEALQGYLDVGAWREVKLILRFLGCLQRLFEGEGIFPLLDELFSRAVDLQTSSSEDSLGLELVKIILFTIPYIMTSSATENEFQASALLEKTDIIASTPHALVALVDPFVTDEGKPEFIQSVVSLLQTQLQEEASKGWELVCIPRPWKIPREDENDGADPLDSMTKHPFPEVMIPNPVKPGPKAILPEIYLSVYAGQEIETVPPPTSVTSLLLRDALIDTINILDFNRVATAKFLIDIDCYFTPDTFVKRATPFDKLREIPSDRSTWKPEDVAVDAVFSQLFQLPAPEHKLIYYHSVLTECCKVAPAAIAPSLGRAIRFLYRSVKVLDLDLCHRFLDWFSHHLSNFGFTWKWTEWIEDLELPVIHPKMSFITGALDKEIRLSFAQRIKGTLPDPYQALILEGKEKDTPDFKYASDSTPYAKEGREIMQLIRKKASDEEIQSVITAIEEQARMLGDPDPIVQSTDAFVTSICYVGAKSLSHVLSCIERNKERLLSVGPFSPLARRQIITSVMEYWADQPGIAINIIDKLLNYTILTPLSVIEWALLDNLAAGKILAKTHVYEMISATIGKVTNRMRQIVLARIQPGLYEPQLSVLDETLGREKGDMHTLFKLIEDSIVSVSNSGSDLLFERGNGAGNQEEDELIRHWGHRWLRVFRRKAAVEEAFIFEAMVNATPLGTVAPIVPQSAEPTNGHVDVSDDDIADIS